MNAIGDNIVGAIPERGGGVISVEVNGVKMKGLLDTVAAISLIKKECCGKLNLKPIPCRIKAKTVNSVSIPILGKVIALLSVGQSLSNPEFYVIETMNYDVIIGRDVISDLGVVSVDLKNKSLCICPHEAYDSNGQCVDASNVSMLPISEISVEPCADTNPIIRIHTLDVDEPPKPPELPKPARKGYRTIVFESTGDELTIPEEYLRFTRYYQPPKEEENCEKPGTSSNLPNNKHVPESQFPNYDVKLTSPINLKPVKTSRKEENHQNNVFSFARSSKKQSEFPEENHEFPKNCHDSQDSFHGNLQDYHDNHAGPSYFHPKWSIQPPKRCEITKNENKNFAKNPEKTTKSNTVTDPSVSVLNLENFASAKNEENQRKPNFPMEMKENGRGKSCSKLNSLLEKDYPEIPESHDFPENHENHEKYVFDKERNILMKYDKRDGQIKPMECEVLSNEPIPDEDPNDPEVIWENFKRKCGYAWDNLPKSPLDEKSKILEAYQENDRQKRGKFSHPDNLLPNYTSQDNYHNEKDNYRKSDTEKMDQIVRDIIEKNRQRKKFEEENSSELSDFEQEIQTIINPVENERGKTHRKDLPDIEENYVNKAVEIPCFYELPEDNEENYINPSIQIPV